MKSIRCLFIVAWVFGLSGVTAHGWAAEVTIHRVCDYYTPVDKAQLLEYASTDLAARGPQPACVVKDPLFSGYRVVSSRVERNSNGAGAVAVLEFEEAARKQIERMSSENRGQQLAVVVAGRIVSLPMITRPYSDNKLIISSASESDAMRIVAAIHSHAQPGAAVDRPTAASPLSSGH